ncbi:MAG: hypothetical protein ACYC97_13490, partial [Metallibacterium sp.]
MRELEMHKRCATRRRRDLLYAGFNLLVLALLPSRLRWTGCNAFSPVGGSTSPHRCARGGYFAAGFGLRIEQLRWQILDDFAQALQEWPHRSALAP